MALSFADSVPAAGSTDKNATEKNAITTDATVNCDKAKMDCPKGAADCPKGAVCPRDKHCPKGSKCAKHGEVKAKPVEPAGSTVAPVEKPPEAAKETAPAPH